MKMHQRDFSNSSLLLFVVASRCSKHVLLLVCCYAQRDLN
uniref:ATP binding protein, putative n=1 Tax=Arundo donax TaxID=35708 RepID=A0A0A9EVB3_ARUDO